MLFESKCQYTHAKGLLWPAPLIKPLTTAPNPLTEVHESLNQIHADVQQLIASVLDQQNEALSMLNKYKDQAAIANIANNADWFCFVIFFSATIAMMLRTQIGMYVNYPEQLKNTR